MRITRVELRDAPTDRKTRIIGEDEAPRYDSNGLGVRVGKRLYPWPIVFYVEDEPEPPAPKGKR